MIALTTFPDTNSAKKFSERLLGDGLAACVNILPRMTSMYWWEGKIEKGSEMMLVIKTRKKHLPAIEKILRENHPYELPEFLHLDVRGSKEYLGWIKRETC